MSSRDVAVLREVVNKLTLMIASRGIRVTQQGAQAFVQHDLKTGKIVRVNIPFIPDNADAAFILAIQGFIDHEVGHVLFTDWAAIGDAKKRGWKLATVRPSMTAEKCGMLLTNLHNIVEDTFIERKMMARFPGTSFNLDRLYEVFLERITSRALGKITEDKDRFSVLLVPLVRAWSGQEKFARYMSAGKYNDERLIKELIDAVPARLVESIRKAKDSWDTLEAAEALFNIIFPIEPVRSEPVTEMISEKGESGKGDTEGKGESKSDEPKSKEEPAEKSEETPPADAEPDEGAADDSEEAESDKPVDGELADLEDDGVDGPSTDDDDEIVDEHPEDEESVGDDGAPELEPEDEAAGEDAGDEASSKSDEGDESEDDKGAGADTDAEEDSEAGAKSEDEDSAEGDADESEGEASTEPTKSSSDEGASGAEVPPSPFTDEEIEISERGLGEAIAGLLTDEAVRQMRGAPYRVFTTDYDRIEPPDTKDFRPASLVRLDEKTRHMVAPMQKDIERMMASRSQVMKVPGYRSGRLHSAALHRLTTGDDRVFRRNHMTRSTATAVSLLIDNSGSMGGSKIQTAMAAGYALSQTLERVGIVHEVLGFTTLDCRSHRAEILEEEARIGLAFSRWESIFMPVFKSFEERMSSEVKRRFAIGYARQIDLLENIDGECVRIATQRLLRRSEPRRVLLVLSDGYPGCKTRDVSGLYADLHRAVEEAGRFKVEVLGIGIESTSVKTFYPQHIVISSVDELPQKVMGEMKRILLRA